MLRLWREILRLWREMLDNTGFWPDDLVGKTVCAGMSMFAICLAAHFAPFTIEAFFAALMAGVFLVLAMLIIAGIGVGVLTGMMVFMDCQAATKQGEATPERHRTAGQEGAAPAMFAEPAPAPESVAQAGEGLCAKTFERLCRDKAE